MFNIACFELGRMFADDSTEQERDMHFENVETLCQHMGTAYETEFKQLAVHFEQNLTHIKQNQPAFIEKNKQFLGTLFNYKF